MVYILGNKILLNKGVASSLTGIYGIGRKRALGFCNELGISPNKRVSELPAGELTMLVSLVENHGSLDSDLQRSKYLDIKRLIDMRSYRGIRHTKGFPVRGQRTSTNARTQRRVYSKRLKRV